VSAPSLATARVALRVALDELARAHRDAAGVCAVYANALALGKGVAEARRAHIAAEMRCLVAGRAVREATREFDTAEAHARMSGEIP
jgi:hypothetical protein